MTAVQNFTHPTWSGAAWRAEVTAWLACVLPPDRVSGEIDQPRVRPWSTQLRIPTSAGLMWFKENAPGLRFEANLLRVLGELVPDAVVVPRAVHEARGWLLSPDCGPTLADAGRTDAPTWVAVLRAYANLQRRVADGRSEVLAAGVPEMGPAAVLAWAGAHAGALSRRPIGDPRRLHPDDLRRLMATIQRWAAAAVELATGPIPLSLEHNDLHTGNAFAPQSGQPLRFFDFGDALWAHPFSSLRIPLATVAQQWQVEPTDRAVSRLRTAYLASWTDLASPRELQRLADLAVGLSPLHRAHAWARCLGEAPADYWGELVGADRDWLLELADPPA